MAKRSNNRKRARPNDNGVEAEKAEDVMQKNESAPPMKKHHRNKDDDAASAHFALAKKLAHNDKVIRNRAIKLVRKWLVSRKELSHYDLMRTWKGLYYCFWMSDKAPVQQELAEKLADLMSTLQEDRCMLYFQAFVDTMIREWTGIDRLRMDKFLSLVRKFIFHSLKYLARKDWPAELVERYIAILQTGKEGSNVPILKCDEGETRGLRLHIIDVFVVELDKVLESEQASESFTFKIFQTLLDPFCILAAQSIDKSTCLRIVSSVFTPLASSMTAIAELQRQAEGEVELEVPLPHLSPFVLQHAKEFEAFVLEYASSKSTKSKCRRAFYDLRIQVLTCLPPQDDEEDTENQTASAPEPPKKKAKKAKKAKNKKQPVSKAADEPAPQPDQPEPQQQTADMEAEPVQTKSSQKKKKRKADKSPAPASNPAPKAEPAVVTPKKKSKANTPDKFATPQPKAAEAQTTPKTESRRTIRFAKTLSMQKFKKRKPAARVKPITGQKLDNTDLLAQTPSKPTLSAKLKNASSPPPSDAKKRKKKKKGKKSAKKENVAVLPSVHFDTEHPSAALAFAKGDNSLSPKGSRVKAADFF